MDTPFIYGKIASGMYFTDREKELDSLKNNFNSLINTILISPRRWGKSSLVLKASEKAGAENKKLRFIFIDLFNIKTEEDFYNVLTREVLGASSTKLEEVIDSAKKFFNRLMPQISFKPDGQMEFLVSFDKEQLSKDPDEILNLAEKIAGSKKLKFVICIDEFQNIAEYEDPDAFQKKLRSNWQKHKNTAYCLYGSKRHMMMDVFTSPSMPFYKFGDLLILEKIRTEDWIPFLIDRFEKTGKKIDEKEAERITLLCECHPYYVQQLAHQAWLRTKTRCWEETIDEAFEDLVRQLSLLFQTMTDDLTQTQTNFLKALLNKESQMSSKDVLRDYKLGTSANVIRIRESLTSKEIIDVRGSTTEFLDPAYKYWLKSHYFGMRSG